MYGQIKIADRKPAGIILYLLVPALLTLGVVKTGYAQESIWESINSTKEYFAAIEDADSALFSLEFENPFLLLLSTNQREEYYKRDSKDEKTALMKEYWWRHNPNPLNQNNPWLKDFIDRNRYVKRNFARNKYPFYDDRGKYWLKYGKPNRHYNDHRTSFYIDSHYYYKYQDETWSYEDIFPDLVVHFQKRFSYFQELGPFQSLGEGRRREFISSMLLQDRLHVSPLIREILQDYPAQGKFMFGNRQRTAIELAPAAAPSKIPKNELLSFVGDISQFRGPNGTTRLEASFLVPLPKNFVKHFFEESGQTLQIEYSAMLRNTNYEIIVSSRSPQEVPISVMAKENLLNAVGKVSLIAPPQAAELTLQVRDLTTDSLGYDQGMIDIRDFGGNDLMISDLQLYKQIEETNTRQSSVLPFRALEGFLVSPYTYLAIRKSEPVLVYYELYNILNGRESADIDFEITVQWDNARQALPKRILGFLKGKQNYSVSFAQTRTFTANAAKEILLLDLSDLEKGPYDLVIKITDIESGQAAFTSVKDIAIADL